MKVAFVLLSSTLEGRPMRQSGKTLSAALVALLSTVVPDLARAATLAELAGWCAPGGNSERLCSGYLETMLEGLASTDPVMNGGNRACVPPDADRAQIIRWVRAYAAQSRAANEISALDGVGAALKGRFPCR